jgi:hypothetical protein
MKIIKQELQKIAPESYLVLLVDFFFFAFYLYNEFNLTLEFYIFLRFLNLVGVISLYILFKIIRKIWLLK